MPLMTKKQEKQRHTNVGLTQSQRAASPGVGPRSHFDENAPRDIETATTTVLSASAFDEFCALLDAPMPKAMRDLLARKAVWG